MRNLVGGPTEGVLSTTEYFILGQCSILTALDFSNSFVNTSVVKLRRS